MVAALVTGAVIVLGALIKGMREHAREREAAGDECASGVAP